MPAIMDQIQSCVSAIRQATSFVPESAVVLGSGLGGFAEKLQVEAQVPYASLPGSTGRFLFGYVDQKPVAVMQGRVHYYEGYSMEQVVLPIRVLGALGAKELLLTNAAGGIGPELTPGCLMLLTGHIASFVPSPLTGPNEEALGPRFPDMSEVYALPLRERAKAAAAELGIPLKEGVYLQTTGPNYETPGVRTRHGRPAHGDAGLRRQRGDQPGRWPGRQAPQPPGGPGGGGPGERTISAVGLAVPEQVREAGRAWIKRMRQRRFWAAVLFFEGT